MGIEGKNDLNRVGWFSEMGYISIGDPYKRKQNVFNELSHKGKQMLPGGSKTRSARQDGYFEKEFSRIMEAESYNDPVKRRQQERVKQSKLNLANAFVPSSGDKLPSGAGNHYGTFSGPVEAFSAAQKDKKSYQSPGKNFITNPPKKGTGFGYINVTIGQTPKYTADPYDRAKEIRNKDQQTSIKVRKGGAFRLNLHPNAFFDGNPYKTNKPLPPLKENKPKPHIVKPFKQSSPGKEIGGCKAGCFETYPSHSHNPYQPKKSSSDPPQGKNIFRPTQGPKSTPFGSIIKQNVERRINATNFRQAVLVKT
ncbi:UPF0602 protein C4orf47 homolog [Xenia sp. Carnegie-2017]|uniref:UPF0602 protein C4orf47 homolog n=1 Tax=Xenia sp. Carnegie-2017 TaxID=2897299 RepID=UPI001F04FF69|nr:UPF0602 protein C4orf47 homolog [Xenia sp. Carnegie-2017]